MDSYGAVRSRAAFAALLFVVAAMLLGGTGCTGSSDAGDGGASSAASKSTTSTAGSTAPTSAAGQTGAPASGNARPGKGGPSRVGTDEELAPGFITDKPRPTETATHGAELKELEVPPIKTVSGVRLPDGVKEARYAVVFEPYGWAPDGQSGKRLIIKISSAKPQGGVELADLSGANAIVQVAPDMVGLFERGGRFEGTIVVATGPEKRTVLRLEKIQSAR